MKVVSVLEQLQNCFFMFSFQPFYISAHTYMESHEINYPPPQDTLTQWWLNVGTSSAILAKHRVYWAMLGKSWNLDTSWKVLEIGFKHINVINFPQFYLAIFFNYWEIL